MEELIIIEYDKEFIPVYKTEKGTEVIRGSELHNGLNVEKAFSTWIKKQLENIDAIENIDFFPLKEESNGGRPFIEYIIKLETAKVFFTKNGILYISNLLINNMYGDYKIKRK